MDLLHVNRDNICAVNEAKPSIKLADGPLTKEKILDAYSDLFTGVGRPTGR